jgi:hypothetical protein
MDRLSATVSEREQMLLISRGSDSFHDSAVTIQGGCPKLNNKADLGLFGTRHKLSPAVARMGPEPVLGSVNGNLSRSGAQERSGAPSSSRLSREAIVDLPCLCRGDGECGDQQALCLEAADAVETTRRAPAPTKPHALTVFRSSTWTAVSSGERPVLKHQDDWSNLRDDDRSCAGRRDFG